MIRILFAFISLSSIFYASPQSEIKSYIEHNLETCGTLEQTEKGFVYVKVSDEFIYSLQEMIIPEGFSPPPYFGEKLVGAHITVIKADEALTDKIEELGEKIFFEVIECQIVYPHHFDGVDAAYILTIESPELDAIREKYGLRKPIYPFHITIGIHKTTNIKFSIIKKKISAFCVE